MKAHPAKIKVYPGFELEKIIPIIKEWYRLMGEPIYEELDEEWEGLKKGEGLNDYQN